MRIRHIFALFAVVLGASTSGAAEPEPKPVRVLVAAGAGSREMSFVQTLLTREAQDKALDLAVYSPGVPPFDPSTVTLERFPNLLRPADKVKAGDKPYNLNSYDVVLAFDLDWTQVEPESLILLQKWVERGGGLVISAGAGHTPKLARAKTDDAALQPVRDLLPVVLSGKEPGASSRTPVRLKFSETKPVAPFLKLDPKGKSDLAGWEEFFGAAEKKDDPPRRGFSSCFPVESVKKGAVTMATFEPPGGKEQAWLAAQAVGKGRVVWLGSGEVYRLRIFEPDAGTGRDYFERFWLGLARYAASSGRP